MHRHKRTHSAKELQEYGEAMGISLTTSGRRGGGRKKKNKERPPSPSQSSTQIKKDERDESSRAESSRQDTGISCPICKQYFFSENMLEAHAHTAHVGQEFKCDLCSFSFLNYSMLKVHKMFHNSQPPMPSSTSANAPIPANLLSTLCAPNPPSSLSSEFSPHQYPQLAKAILANEEFFRATSTGSAAAISPAQHPPGLVVSANGKSPLSAFARAVDKSQAIAATRVPSISNSPPLNTTDREDGGEASNGVDSALKQPSKKDNSRKKSPSRKSDDIDTDDSSQKDLADVQSILSITRLNNGSTGNNSMTNRSDEEEDEDECDTLPPGSQDDNDPILKDMKMKGEFPCRLCPAVYPNLRALKGHNKEHLHKAPYCCNVGKCEYSSNDKGTLARHMRTHTGEKPYECRICNYGFTTKANCERHLKNKHGKTSRDQIRQNLVIHEHEESLSESSKVSSGNQAEGVQQTATGTNNFRCKVCKQLFPSSDRVIAHAIKDHPAYASDVDHIFEEIRPRLNAGGNGTGTATAASSVAAARNVLGGGDLGAPSMVPRVTNYPPLSQLRPLLQPKDKSDGAQGNNSVPTEYDNQQSETKEDDEGEEAPLDLSQPSKQQSAETTDDSTVPNMPLILPPNLDSSFREEILRNGNAMGLLGAFSGLSVPAAAAGSGASMRPSSTPFPFSLHPTLLSAAAAALNMLPGQHQLQSPSRGHQQLLPQHPTHPGISGLPPSAPPPPVPQPQPQPPQGPAAALSTHHHLIGGAGSSTDVVASYISAAASAQQELLRKQQLAAAATAAAAAAAATAAAAASSRADASIEEKSNASVDQQTVVTMHSSPEKELPNRKQGRDLEAGGKLHNNSDSDSNYKMVIQNGVLMKKQKQRRYRTERPYGCDHCKARFTLRSNMERHIKQQHPQFWSSKPRGSRRNHTATVPILAPQYRMDPSEEAGVDDDRDNGDGDRDSLVIDESDGGGKGDDLASISNLIKTAEGNGFKKLLNDCNDHDEFDGEFGEDEEVSTDDEEEEEDEPDDDSSEADSGDKKGTSHKFACTFCPRKFPWSSSLSRHLLTHTGDKPFKCDSCPLLFTTKSNCDRHHSRKHGEAADNANGEWKCEKCGGRSFQSSAQLREHRRSVHIDSDVSMSNEEEEEEIVTNCGLPFKCHLCEEAFPERSEAIGHLQISHAEDYETLVTKGAFVDKKGDNGHADDQDDNDSVEDDRRVTCIFCLNNFFSPLDLRRHIRKHTRDRPHTCKMCHKRFALKNSLFRHMRKKHNSPALNSVVEEQAEEEEDHIKQPPINNNKRKRANLMDTIAKLSSTAKKAKIN